VAKKYPRAKSLKDSEMMQLLKMPAQMQLALAGGKFKQM
jgi:hypothetical protein